MPVIAAFTLKNFYDRKREGRLAYHDLSVWKLELVHNDAGCGSLFTMSFSDCPSMNFRTPTPSKRWIATGHGGPTHSPWSGRWDGQ